MKLSEKSLFPYAGQVTYLHTAAEGLPLDASNEALTQYFREKSSGSTGRRNLYEVEADLRRLTSSLLGCRADDIALLGSASEGINLLANSIDWRPGDEVLVCDLEFPSNVLPWIRLREQGVQLRIVPSHAGVITYEEFASNINPHTRLVTVSQVSYKSGTRFPFLRRLAKETHRVGAVFCVDATQAMGRIHIDLDEVDYLVSSSYKWLLGSHGLGIVYIAPALRERISPSTIGWYSVKDIFSPYRFQQFEHKSGANGLVAGMPNFPAMYVLREGLRYLLQRNIQQLDSALHPLIQQTRNGLAALQLDLLTPENPAYHSGIVAFAHPKAEQIRATLEKEGVIVWGGDGRVRASFHLYNDEADVQRYLSALSAILPQMEIAHRQSDGIEIL